MGIDGEGPYRLNRANIFSYFPIPADVVTTVAAHVRPEPVIGDEQVEALGELVPVGVIEAGVALDAVIDQHLAARVGENRRADRKHGTRERPRDAHLRGDVIDR